jgi:P27 family predicted phage terminase small subunit
MVPAVLRKLHGNPRKVAMPADIPEGQGELWAPPGWFDNDQRAQWRYALDNAPPGLLTGTDREVLAIWCVAAVEHARAAVQVRHHGQVVKTKEGNAIQNPFLGIVNRQGMIMLRAGAEMGFSPAARMTLGRQPGDGESTRYIGLSRARTDRLEAYLAAKPDRLDDP